jgi:hypothetical protein
LVENFVYNVWKNNIALIGLFIKQQEQNIVCYPAYSNSPLMFIHVMVKTLELGGKW